MAYPLEDQVSDLTAENEKLTEEIATLEDDIGRQRAVIQGLADALGSSLALADRLMDEILHLHRHANEMLPMSLIEAKDELDKTIRKLLEGHRGS